MTAVALPIFLKWLYLHEICTHSPLQINFRSFSLSMYIKYDRNDSHFVSKFIPEYSSRTGSGIGFSLVGSDYTFDMVPL